MGSNGGLGRVIAAGGGERAAYFLEVTAVRASVRASVRACCLASWGVCGGTGGVLTFNRHARARAGHEAKHQTSFFLSVHLFLFLYRYSSLPSNLYDKARLLCK